MAVPMLPGPRTRTPPPRVLASLGSALIAVSLATGSASATVIERDRAANHYEFTAWDCGYPMQVVGDDSHLFQLRADNNLDGNAFFTDNYQFRETWTAPDG